MTQLLTGGGGHYLYSIVGDTANTAARLESLNKHLGTHVLGRRVYSQAWLGEAVQCFQVTDLTTGVSSAWCRPRRTERLGRHGNNRRI
jgi:class 3 adenylate cyclase